MENQSEQTIPMENTSGKGATAVVPLEIKKWNWGAFFLSWIWGISHNTWIAFLTFIPYLGVIMNIILGIKGSEWAWQNRRFEGGVEEFKQVQRIWAKWAIIIFLVAIGLTIVSAVLVAVLVPLLNGMQRGMAGH